MCGIRDAGSTWITNPSSNRPRNTSTRASGCTGHELMASLAPSQAFANTASEYQPSLQAFPG